MQPLNKSLKGKTNTFSTKYILEVENPPLTPSNKRYPFNASKKCA